jgi:hypothetical protein
MCLHLLYFGDCHVYIGSYIYVLLFQPYGMIKTKNMADLHDLKKELQILSRNTVLTVGMLILMIELAEEKEAKRTQDLDDAYWDTQSDTF